MLSSTRKQKGKTEHWKKTKDNTKPRKHKKQQNDATMTNMH